MASQEEIADFVAEEYGIAFDTYVTLAGIALILYEYLVTFSDEVKLFWLERKTSAAFLFLANRYLTVLNYGFTLFAEFPPSQSLLAYTIDHCVWNETEVRGNSSTLVVSRTQAIISILPYVIWAVFLALRTYAVSGKNRFIASVVFLLSMSSFAVNVTRINSLFLVDVPGVGLEQSIDETDAQVKLVPLVLADIIAVYVTWRKLSKGRLQEILPRASSVSDVFLRDGTLYFTTLFVLNTMHLSLTLFSIDDPGNNSSIITAFTDPLTAILVSRFMLDLQAASKSSTGMDSYGSIATFDAFERALGSLGATIPSDEYAGGGRSSELVLI